MKSRAASLLILLAAGLVACGGGGPAPVDTAAAQLTANELRDGQVASTLDVFQHVVDIVAPVPGFATFDEIAHMAEQAGCALLVRADGSYELVCPELDLRGEIVSLRLVLTFLSEGFPVDDPALADSVEVALEVDGEEIISDGLLLLFEEFDRGLVIQGSLDSSFVDGTTMEATVGEVTARTIADLPGVALGALFTSGNVDLGGLTPAGDAFSGTAGMVGRSAVVALEVFGIFSHGEIALGG